MPPTPRFLIIDGYPKPSRDEFDVVGMKHASRLYVEMLKKHGFEPSFQETPGAHTWINWRDYLNEFAPQLFQ
jgi:enterochelin esterase-like enzyme